MLQKCLMRVARTQKYDAWMLQSDALGSEQIEGFFEIAHFPLYTTYNTYNSLHTGQLKQGNHN